MGFNIDKLMGNSFVPREDIVPLPDLAEFFPDKEKPEFTVRGLNGIELARVNESVEKNRNLTGIIEGLVSPDQRDKIDALRDMVGLGNKTPDEIVRRVQLLIIGSVEPKFQQDQAVRFCRVYPIEFYQITNKITQLTGQGHILGKPKPSGETQA